MIGVKSFKINLYEKILKESEYATCFIVNGVKVRLNSYRGVGWCVSADNYRYYLATSNGSSLTRYWDSAYIFNSAIKAYIAAHKTKWRALITELPPPILPKIYLRDPEYFI